MQKSQIKAKVFISCGQRKDNHEIETAHKIKTELEKLGYDPYIAVEEQTLKGLKENIFHQLETSEYFLFIDFKREQVISKDITEHRGSLFSHQELAIASFLDIPLIAFQEKGVKKDDGIMKFIQANCIEFTDRKNLPVMIVEYVKQNWNPNWKNQITLERGEKDYQDPTKLPEEKPARFFHIKVRNLHDRKLALNCCAYLKSIKNLSSGEDRILETFELKWKGVTFRSVVILPSSHRYLDGFFVFHDSPDTAILSISPFIDFTGYYTIVRGPGDFELTYLIISENFGVTEATFKLRIGNNLQDISFEKIK